MWPFAFGRDDRVAKTVNDVEAADRIRKRLLDQRCLTRRDTCRVERGQQATQAIDIGDGLETVGKTRFDRRRDRKIADSCQARATRPRSHWLSPRRSSCLRPMLYARRWWLSAACLKRGDRAWP